ncbi:hypothetical protein E2562_019288 [Oryza meyeriana var. granulata]|uniref:Uncharacterized protein n=1 Tax=Oryza meyeriana var. granulata TaxID=110450 RepID=A0A6G1FAI0_9ORYZ|nr:hypothetical protein E2562_019288 [Oryza meyeriana var. granulata]
MASKGGNHGERRRASRGSGRASVLGLVGEEKKKAGRRGSLGKRQTAVVRIGLRFDLGAEAELGVGTVGSGVTTARDRRRGPGILKA